MTTVVKTMLPPILGGIVFFIAACAPSTELGITHLPDRFTEREYVRSALYVPEARLIPDEQTVVNWDRRLGEKFEHAPGENYILHIEHAHYDKKGGVVEPDYSYQVNIEIPGDQFEPGVRIPATSLKGFLVWGGENSIYRREYASVVPNSRFVPSEKGWLRIERIRDDGTLVATTNLYFRNGASREEIRVFGKVVARRVSRDELYGEEARAKRQIHERAEQIKGDAWKSSQYHSLEKF